MPFWSPILRLVKDPPPGYVFELSEAGIAFATESSHGRQTGFEPLEPGVLLISPLEDNLARPDAVTAALAHIAPVNGSRRRPAAVILPDHAARVSLLDFDSFPSSAEEQLALIRFRVKKTIPFDIEAAAVSFWTQPSVSGSKKTDVVAVTVALEILARYETVFRNAGFLPGAVTVSSLAALNLYHEAGVAVIAKLAGNVLSVMAVAGGRLKLFRCLTVDPGSVEEILAVLHPTFAYIEDELGQKPEKLILCGFGEPPAGLQIPTEPLRSRMGAPGAFNAGLLGYLEAAG